MFVRTVTLIALLSATASIAAASSLSMPSAVEAPVPAAASATLRPTVVFNGTGYLVLWTYASSNQPTGRIWGTRVDLNGNPLELWGFPVADPGPLDDGLHPIAAAFDGTHYLVVWELYGVIYGKLIDATGTPLPAGQFTIASNPNVTYSEPVVTHDGKQYVVVYQGSEILATRVSNAGAILNSTALTVSRTGSAMTDSKPAIAFDGTNTVVVWHAANLDGARILAARIDTNGSLLGTKDIVVSDTAAKPQNPDVVFGSSNGLVVWEDTRNVTTSGGTSDIYGALLGKNGSVSSAGLVVASGVAAKHEPAVSLDGTNFLVVWEDGRTSGTLYVEKIYGVRITAAGAPVEVPFRISQGAGNHDYARVASDGTSALVVFEGAGPFGTTVVNGSVGGMRVKSGTIQTAANLILSTRGNRQQAPAAAFDGSKHLVVWEDDRKGYPSIWGVRVDETGKPESATIDIGQGLDQTSPRVAFNGTDYLVVWLDCQAYSGIDCSRYEVRGARVSRDGQVRDTVDGFYIGGTTAQSLAVGSNGQDFLVAWQNGFYDRSNLHAARVGADGVVVDTTPLIVCDAANGQYQPRVASDGTNYLVVWNDMRTGTRGDIYGAGISSAGKVLHANGFPVANRAESEWNADVAFNGNDYFVVWSRQNPSPAMDDIFGSRVTPAWTVVDAASPQVVISEATPQTDPRITFARDEYIVDWVNGDSLSPNQMDLRARRLTRDGTVVNATPMILAAGESYNEQHEVVAGADGSFMVTYSRTEPSPLGTYTRVYVRTASRLGQGTQCSVSAECSSGQCIDGVCCESACGGGSQSDCQACSVAAGASVDGVCGIVAPGRSCRPAAGSCDEAEVCSGTAAECPPDSSKPDGLECDDSNACTTVDRCQAGQCSGSAPLQCSTADVCTVASCEASSGTCMQRHAPNGTACPGGACQNGACQPSVVVPGPGGSTDGGSGTGPDTGGDTIPPDSAQMGCGCQTGTNAAIGWASLVLALGLRRRQIVERRQKRTPSRH